MTMRTVSLTDWRIRDEDLPEIPPGQECERVITPQRHSVLQQITVIDLKLERLRIGAIYSVPFEICAEGGAFRSYRPVITDAEVAKRLADRGIGVVSRSAIRICAGLDVCLILLNDRAAPAKPCVSLLVREEIQEAAL